MTHDILAKLKEGQVPEGVRRSAARGVLPVSREELLAILVFLHTDPDPEVRRASRQTLSREFCDDLLQPIVESSSTPAEVLEHFARPPFRCSNILEGLIQNKATPDSTVASLAEQVESPLIDVILIDLMRLLRSPFVLEALERNPHRTPDVSRRLKEIRQEFFEKRNTFIPVHRSRAEPTAVDRKGESAGRATQPTEAEGSDSLAAHGGPVKQAEDVVARTAESLAEDGLASFEAVGAKERLSTIQRITSMTVAERVQMALKGSREERLILIRDSNRLVASAVLQSPKLSESEVEAVALMTNVSEEVLRLIGAKREFVRNYAVIHNLVKNPRTPLGTSLLLLSRILTTDLKPLARSRNIPEVLRKAAQRQLQTRTAPKEAR
jgi:hypothetical protein